MPRGVPLYGVQQRIVDSRHKLEKDFLFWEYKKLRLIRMLAALTPPIPVLLRCIMEREGVPALYNYVHQYFQNFRTSTTLWPNAALCPVDVLTSAIEIETEYFDLQRAIDTLNERIVPFLQYRAFEKALHLIKVYFEFKEKPFVKRISPDADVIMHTKNLFSRQRLHSLKNRLLHMWTMVDKYIANTFYSEEWHEHINFDGNSLICSQKIDSECEKVMVFKQVTDFFCPCPFTKITLPFEKIEHIKEKHLHDASDTIFLKYNEWKDAFGFHAVRCLFPEMGSFGAFGLEGINSFVEETSKILSSGATIDFWVLHFALTLMERTLLEIMAPTSDNSRRYKFGIYQVEADKFIIEEGSLLGIFVICIILSQIFLYPRKDSCIFVCDNKRFTLLHNTQYFIVRIQSAQASKPIGKKGVDSLFFAMLDVFHVDLSKSKIKSALLRISRILLPEMNGLSKMSICSACVPKKGFMPNATSSCTLCNGTLFIEGHDDNVHGFSDSSMYGAMKTGLFDSIRTSRMNLAKYCNPTDVAVLRTKFAPKNNVEQSIFETMNLHRHPVVIPTTKKRKHGV